MYNIKNTFVYFFLIAFSNLFSSISVQAQFQNNNTSCEDKVVVGGIEVLSVSIADSIACGFFDEASTEEGFADCALQRDGVTQSFPNTPTHNILMNTEAHGDNCLNAGGQNPQFAAPIQLFNQELMGNITTPIRMGTLLVGDLDGSAFEDISFLYSFNPNEHFTPSRSLQFILGPQNGIYNPGDFSPTSALFAQELPVDQRPMAFPSNVFVEDVNLGSERSRVMLDCDQDGFVESVAAVRTVDQPDQKLGFMLLQNNGAGFISNNLVDFVELPVPVSAGGKAAVTLSSGDYNGDGFFDIVAAVNTDLAGEDAVVLCLGADNACGFSCPPLMGPNIVDLGDAYPTSIESGDFDGDSTLDFAVSLTANSSVRYFFNPSTGAGIQTWSTSDQSLGGGPGTARPLVLRAGRFSTIAVQNNIDELAVTVPHFVLGGVVDFLTGEQRPSQVAVFTSNGNGGLNPAISLDFSVVNSIGASGIEVKNFDRCGGDDLIALNHTREDIMVLTRRASLFLNENEVPLINLSDQLSGEVGESLVVSADCQDPTFDDRDFQWQLTSAPAGSNPSLSTIGGNLVRPKSDSSTNFSTDLAGEYSLTLSCIDFCGAVVSKSVLLNISAPGSDTGSGTDTGTGTGVEETRTQGGCVANSLVGSRLSEQLFSIWGMILPLALLMVRKFRK